MTTKEYNKTEEGAEAARGDLLYQVKLTGGQTYRIAGNVFEHGDEFKTVSKSLYETLQREAIKSVKQGDDDDAKRANIALFEYRIIPAGEGEKAEDDNSPALSGAGRRTRGATNTGKATGA